MSNVGAQKLLSELQRNRRAKPTVSYSEYWKELRQAVEKENAAF
jgi:hypothetical protein